MILPSDALDKSKSLPNSEPADSPPAYSRAPPLPPRPSSSSTSSSSRTLSLSRNTQPVVPFSAPINGLHMYTKHDPIRGAWSLDPLAPQVPEPGLVQMFLDGQPAKKKKRCCRSRSSKAVPPTAKLASRHGSIQAKLRVLGDSVVHSLTTIRAESRSGNVTLDLVSIAPTRTVHVDAYSRKGSVTLLVPRSYCGLVQLSSRHGPVVILPALAASGRVISTKNRETTVLLGDGPMPAMGADGITDTARLYSRHGRVRLGFSGEDYFTEPPSLVDQAIQLVQKLMMPSGSSQKAIS